MARWHGEGVKVDWTAGAPYIELTVRKGSDGAPEQTVRMRVENARELLTVLGVAIGETDTKSKP